MLILSVIILAGIYDRSYTFKQTWPAYIFVKVCKDKIALSSEDFCPNKF